MHRDIKSTNIMLTETGRVKIMGFGLARISAGAEVTRLGSTLGTVAYMSPEQASELIADLHRIKKVSATKELLSKSGMRRSLPQKRKRLFVVPGIVAIIILLLIANYFFFNNETPIKERIPVAVADFVNETNEPELNSLSGMLITALEKSRRLSVLTRSRMFDVLRQIGKEDVSYIDEQLGREICRKLDVRALAISTIRKFGNNYAIDLKIIDPVNDTYLFTTGAQATGQEEIPAMIDRISDQTREGLREKENDLIQTSQSVKVVTTSNLEAYQHYFKGKEYLGKMRYRNAEEELRKAVQLDSTFGLVIYQLAVAQWQRGPLSSEIECLINKAMDMIDSIPEREQYLLQAFYNAINDNIREAISILLKMEQHYRDDKEMCALLASYAFQEENYPLAQEYFEKVIKLDPQYKLAWDGVEGSLPDTYSKTGKIEEGLAKLIRLKTDYPGAIIIGRKIADFYCYLDKYKEAEFEYEEILKMEQPLESKIENLFNKAFFLLYPGKYKEALKVLDTCISLTKQAGDSSLVVSRLAFKSIFYVWGWNDIENAKFAAREADKYHKHYVNSRRVDLRKPLNQ